MQSEKKNGPRPLSSPQSRTKFASPSPALATGHYTAASRLRSQDYLNASASDPPPFAFCPVFGPNDTIAQRRGQLTLLKSRVHLGSGARIQRVIQKAMAGQPVTISVLGGSVSACHGAGDDLISPRCWPAKFFEWWNKVFPHQRSELTNGAARKHDSAYFAYCSTHHLPDETDLVILDFDASDPNDPHWIRHFELLVRSILVRPEQPAVIMMGHFAPQVLVQNGFAGPELLHDIVGQFYDVPHLSVKGMLYQDYMVNPEGTRQSYYTDMVLAAPPGHELIADMLISYMQSQICSGWAAIMGHAFDVPYMGAQENAPRGADVPAQTLSDEEVESEGGPASAKARLLAVPQVRLADPPSAILTFREVKPFCTTANDLINPLPPSHFFGSGWHASHPKKSDAEARHYWWAEIGGSAMRVPIKVSAGEVAIYYLQAPEGNGPAHGRVACWVDDDYANRVELDGMAPNVDDVTPTLTVINEGVAEGEHYVECQLLGTKGVKAPQFKMLGVFAT